MGDIRLFIKAPGLLDYAKTGRQAVLDVRKAVEHVLLIGRTEARTKITSQFRIRTGRLQGESARGMKTNILIQNDAIYGKISPMPHLMNIFERGATLPARTITPKSANVLAMPNASGDVVFGASADIPSVKLRPRPVIKPARDLMEREAPGIFERLMQRVGQA